nr:TRAP transporter substrate-binding protein [Paracoccus alkanivorans]
MMLNRRNFTRLAGAAVIGLPALHPARAEARITIKFSHVVAPDTPKGKAADRFRELAEKYTEGAVNVEIYPGSQLYKDKVELEALQLGAVQMLAPSLAKFSPLGAQQFELFDLPVLFDGRESLRKITEGEIGEELLKMLEPRGIEGLAFWDNGFKIMSANSPLHWPGDFKGLKMRIQASKTLEAQMLALGAMPQVLAFSEVYQALATGIVDGTENPPSNMFTQNMHEVQKHATISRHGYIGYALIVNQAYWKNLPGDIRTELDRAVLEATEYGNSIAEQVNDEALEAMKALGTTRFHELTGEERAAWLAALKPVHEQMADRIGPDLIQQVYDELELDR